LITQAVIDFIALTLYASINEKKLDCFISFVGSVINDHVIMPILPEPQDPVEICYNNHACMITLAFHKSHKLTH
jgi:hypothetical protein